MSEHKEIFDRAVEEGLDKNGILMILITEGGLDVQAAVREYAALAREAGMTMSKEQRTVKIVEVLEESDLSTKGGVDDARDQLMDSLDVAPSTASGYIRDFAEANDIELPTAARRSFASKEDVVGFLIANNEKKRVELSAGLMEEFGYAKGSADTITGQLGYMIEYARQTNENS